MLNSTNNYRNFLPFFCLKEPTAKPMDYNVFKRIFNHQR
jgi:hypothetical protein